MNMSEKPRASNHKKSVYNETIFVILNRMMNMSSAPAYRKNFVRLDILNYKKSLFINVVRYFYIF